MPSKQEMHALNACVNVLASGEPTMVDMRSFRDGFQGNRDEIMTYLNVELGKRTNGEFTIRYLDASQAHSPLAGQPAFYLALYRSNHHANVPPSEVIGRRYSGMTPYAVSPTLDGFHMAQWRTGEELAEFQACRSVAQRASHRQQQVQQGEQSANEAISVLKHELRRLIQICSDPDARADALAHLQHTSANPLTLPQLAAACAALGVDFIGMLGDALWVYNHER